MAPNGFAPTTVHPEDMKAGSHIDLVSLYDKPTVDGLTTLGVMAFDAGEPVTDDPITLGSRFWREIGPGGSNPPPITAGVLGGLPAFEVASTRRRRGAHPHYLPRRRGRLVGRGGDVHGRRSRRDRGARPRLPQPDLDGRALGRAAGRTDQRAGDVRGGRAVHVRRSRRLHDLRPGSRPRAAGGVPASLVLRSWENRVLVFASDAGRPLTSIDPAAFCGVVEKILPGTSTTPISGTGTIGGERGVRCDARSFTDSAGRTIPGLEVDAHGTVHGTRLRRALLLDARPAQRGAGRLPVGARLARVPLSLEA